MHFIRLKSLEQFESFDSGSLYQVNCRGFYEIIIHIFDYLISLIFVLKSFF